VYVKPNRYEANKIQSKLLSTEDKDKSLRNVPSSFAYITIHDMQLQLEILSTEVYQKRHTNIHEIPKGHVNVI
jgi:hypothetical protein